MAFSLGGSFSGMLDGLRNQGTPRGPLTPQQRQQILSGLNIFQRKIFENAPDDQLLGEATAHRQHLQNEASDPWNTLGPLLAGGVIGAGAIAGGAGADAATAGAGGTVAEGTGGSAAAGGAGMPAAIPEADPTFGGLLSQTSPGVFSASADTAVGEGALPGAPGASTAMPPAVAEADPTFGGVLTASPDAGFGTLMTSAGGGNMGTTASPALIDPASGPVGGSGVSATAGDPFSAGYDLTDSLGGTGDSLAASVAGGSGATAGSTLGGITDFLGANKSLVIPGAILGAELLNKPKVPQVPNLENLANTLQNGPSEKATQDAATNLIPSVSTGILPPGADSMVNNAVHDAQGTIRAKYAQLGMSGSTSETQELAAAEARGEAMRFSFAQQLTQTGLQAAGIAAGSDAQAAQIYALIMNAQLQQDAALQNALSNFASSASLGLGLSDIASKL